MDAKKHNDLTKLVSKGDAKEIEKVMRRGGADASNLAAMMAKAKANATKQADAYGAYLGGSNLGTLGAVVGGLGGGLGGGISGAYSAPKGQKLRGALSGAGRGALQGGLIGGGVGVGTGAVLGGHLPFSQILANAKLPAGSEEKTQAQQGVIDQIKKINPNLLAGLTTAGGMGGGALGSYLAHEALRPADEDDQDEKAKQAALQLSPHTGIKTPNKQDAGKNFNNMIEQARRNREDKERRMRAVNNSKSQIVVDSSKAASAWPRIKQALSIPSYRKAHKAQNRARYAALLAGDKGRHRSFEGANPALLDAHHYNYVKDRWNSEKRDLQRAAQLRDAAGKKASAFEFGQWLKQAAIDWNSIGETAKQVWNDPTTQAGVQYGGIGAGLGGLYGLVNPGEYEDEYGNVRRRGRLMGALRGAAGGGLLGGAVGAGAQEGRHQYLKHLMSRGELGAENANALPHTDRATALRMTDQWAQDNPDQAGNLTTSPLAGLRDAYSQYVAPTMARFKPKKPMGAAPSTGVDPQTTAPKMPTIDSPGEEIYGN